ncbi:ArpU family phage packaging/lysis transcriptional regulator [Fructilactobacillus frigidiflavus]
MQLFPEVDEKKTIKNAKNFFKKQLPRMMTQARISSLSIQSPSISDMPSGGAYGNSNENKYVLMLQRQKDVREVFSTLKGMNKLQGYILNAVYLEGREDWKIAQEIGYSQSRYHDLKNLALINFACALDVYDVDLTVYDD